MSKEGEDKIARDERAMTGLPPMWDQPHGAVQVSLRAMEVQEKSRESGDLLVWTVTYNHSDAPGLYVVRPHSTINRRPEAFSLRSPDLMRLRAMLPPDLYRMARNPSDDPVIVEVWV
jgi:hypothetical protein